MGTKDKAITPEVVEAPEPPEVVERIVVEFDGADWDVPPSFDALPYEATIAFARLAASADDGDLSIVPLVRC